MQQTLSRILEIDPKNTSVWIRNAKALFLLDRFEDAKDSLDNATELEQMNILRVETREKLKNLNL